MYIGELSKKSGASRKAIYLYEQMGLIPKPTRKGSYRIYPAAAVTQIQTIRCAQTLGFKLKELVDALASNNNDPRSSMALMLEQIELKRSVIHSQIETAQAQLLLLNQLEHELLHSPELLLHKNQLPGLSTLCLFIPFGGVPFRPFLKASLIEYSCPD